MKSVVTFLLCLASVLSLGQDKIDLSRIVKVADNYLKNIVGDSLQHCYRLDSQENFLVDKWEVYQKNTYDQPAIGEKKVYWVPYYFIENGDTIASSIISIDENYQIASREDAPNYGEMFTPDIIKGYALSFAGKFNFGFYDAKKFALDNNLNSHPFLATRKYPYFTQIKTKIYIQIKYVWVLVSYSTEKTIRIELDTDNGEVLSQSYLSNLKVFMPK